MSQDNTPSETASNRADNQSTAASRLPKQAALIVVSLSLFAVEAAAVQSAVRTISRVYSKKWTTSLTSPT